MSGTVRAFGELPAERAILCYVCTVRGTALPGTDRPGCGTVRQFGHGQYKCGFRGLPAEAGRTGMLFGLSGILRAVRYGLSGIGRPVNTYVGIPRFGDVECLFGGFAGARFPFRSGAERGVYCRVCSGIGPLSGLPLCIVPCGSAFRFRERGRSGMLYCNRRCGSGGRIPMSVRGYMCRVRGYTMAGAGCTVPCYTLLCGAVRFRSERWIASGVGYSKCTLRFEYNRGSGAGRGTYCAGHTYHILI